MFLPLVLALYFLAKDKYKNYVLLVTSLVFYAWGEPKYIVLMVLSIVVNYLLAWLIDKNKKKELRKKVYLTLSIVLNIGALFVFKYLDFAILNVNLAFGFNLKATGLVLPIGISFYTFQILSYVIDVYRGKVKCFYIGYIYSVVPAVNCRANCAIFVD